MCTNMIGKADAMSPQEQLRYKEAMDPSALAIPTTPVVNRDDSYVAPTGASVRMPDGRMVTQASDLKLQQMLKKRGK